MPKPKATDGLVVGYSQYAQQQNPKPEVPHSNTYGDCKGTKTGQI